VGQCPFAGQPNLYSPLQRQMDFSGRYLANSISDGFELCQSGAVHAANWLWRPMTGAFVQAILPPLKALLHIR